jgi:hypothetical protein
MSDDDVDPIEMNEPPAFDENAIEALMAGHGRAASTHVADLVDDLRVAYTSVPPTVGPELAALMATALPAAAASLAPRRFERMRSSMLARMGAAAAVVAAATGGLAVAQALPAPVQDLMSHIGAPSAHHDSGSASTDDATTTTSTEVSNESTTPTTTDNHGAIVSGVAHDHSNTDCPHGAIVSQVASDGRSHNDGQNAGKNTSDDGSCTTTTTVDNGTPSTTSTTTSATEDTQGEHGGTTPTSDPGVSGGDHGTSHGSQSEHGKGGS